VTLRGLEPLALPLAALALGLGLATAALRERVVTITFQRDGRAFRTGDGVRHPLPATMTLDDIGAVRLRVVNRDERSHAVGVLSVQAGDSVEVHPDACAPAPRERALVLLIR
jgi:hypothetical protein